MAYEKNEAADEAIYLDSWLQPESRVIQNSQRMGNEASLKCMTQRNKMEWSSIEKDSISYQANDAHPLASAVCLPRHFGYCDFALALL